LEGQVAKLKGELKEAKRASEEARQADAWALAADMKARQAKLEEVQEALAAEKLLGWDALAAAERRHEEVRSPSCCLVMWR
jgi:hypothetical protein